MYCRNCGKEINESAAFCVGCGVKNGVGQKFCPNCGEATEEIQAVCIKCGYSLTDSSRTGNGNTPKKTLHRCRENKILAGICSGFAKQYDIDPWVVRILFMLANIFLLGLGTFLYIIMIFTVKYEDQ